MTQYKDTLRKNGWVLIKNFFDKETTDQLRESCVNIKGELHQMDLLSNKHVNHLFLNERFIGLLSQMLGDKPVYFGDSGFQVASVEGRISNGFHKDCVDRKNQDGRDWQNSDYSLIRVGIYLQDHKNFSEGLVVRNNSHRTTNLLSGEKINVPSQKGDLIIWYLTTTHSGNAKRIKWLDYPVLMGDYTGGWLAHRLYYHLPKMFIQPSEKDRVALFMTFGKKDIHLERYLKYLKHRKYMIDIWKKINYDNALLRKIEEGNMIEVINMKEEANKIDMSTYIEYDFDNYSKFNI